LQITPENSERFEDRKVNRAGFAGGSNS
jgi:hypothetical protein